MKHQGRLNHTECNAGPKQRVHGPDHIKENTYTPNYSQVAWRPRAKRRGGLEPSTFVYLMPSPWLVLFCHLVCKGIWNKENPLLLNCCCISPELTCACMCVWYVCGMCLFVHACVWVIPFCLTCLWLFWHPLTSVSTNTPKVESWGVV